MAKMGKMQKTINASCWQAIGANQDSDTGWWGHNLVQQLQLLQVIAELTYYS